VGLLFGSANRDESVFERSDRLVLDRAHNPHVSFGAGVHFCVGAPLALVELEVALERMASRVGSIEVAADRLPRTPSLIFRGVDRLPADLTPAG
jgi:cytochrome P450